VKRREERRREEMRSEEGEEGNDGKGVNHKNESLYPIDA
jgi:hypothetical protein